jgi:hypothetical protein
MEQCLSARGQRGAHQGYRAGHPDILDGMVPPPSGTVSILMASFVISSGAAKQGSGKLAG